MFAIHRHKGKAPILRWGPSSKNLKQIYSKTFNYEKIFNFSLRSGFRLWGLLLGVLLVLAHELIDAAGGVNELHLAGEEGVGGVGDFQLDDGVLLAIGIDDGLLRGGAALREDHVLVRHVFEDNEAIVFGMDAFFHVLCCILPF